MDLPKRKNTRLKDCDYSQNGYYFVTICVKNKKCILWNNVGATCGRPIGVNLPLSNIGNVIENEITKIHTFSRIIQQFKGSISKQIGSSIWQKLYYDHIIRNEQSYNEIIQYIEANPLKWREDKYFVF